MKRRYLRIIELSRLGSLLALRPKNTLAADESRGRSRHVLELLTHDVLELVELSRLLHLDVDA